MLLQTFRRDSMLFDYEFKNKKLKAWVEKEAEKYNTTVDDMIYCYINRELISDSLDEDTFYELHSKEYMDEVNSALNLD